MLGLPPWKASRFPLSIGISSLPPSGCLLARGLLACVSMCVCVCVCVWVYLCAHLRLHELLCMCPGVLRFTSALTHKQSFKYAVQTLGPGAGLESKKPFLSEGVFFGGACEPASVMQTTHWVQA